MLWIIVMILSAVWTFILTAPIHHMAWGYWWASGAKFLKSVSKKHTLIYCYFKWRNMFFESRWWWQDFRVSFVFFKTKWVFRSPPWPNSHPSATSFLFFLDSFLFPCRSSSIIPPHFTACWRIPLSFRKSNIFTFFFEKSNRMLLSWFLHRTSTSVQSVHNTQAFLLIISYLQSKC